MGTQTLPIDAQVLPADIVIEADIVPFYASVVARESDPRAQKIAVQIMQFEADGLALAERIGKLAISDQTSYTAAAELLKEGNDFIKGTGGFFEPIRQITYGLYQIVLDRKKKVQAAVEGKLPVLKTGILAFERRMEEIRKQQEREASELQRREEEELKLQSAADAEAVGMDKASVQSILDAPSTTPAPSVAPSFQRVAGVSSRDNWCAEITDLHALVKAIAKNKNLLPLIEANMPALNAQARAMKDALVIPGVRAVNKGSLAVRGGK